MSTLFAQKFPNIHCKMVLHITFRLNYRMKTKIFNCDNSKTAMFSCTSNVKLFCVFVENGSTKTIIKSLFGTLLNTNSPCYSK